MPKETAINGGETLPDSEELGRRENHYLELSLEGSVQRNSRAENSPPLFTQVDPRRLKPHPQNSSIYGEDEDVSELVDLIRDFGLVKPLLVTPTDTIISGHRRWKAVLALGLKSVFVEVREFSDETAELQALLLENATRVKTVEQKVREAYAWKSIESAVAHRRQLATQNNHAGRAVRENFPQLLSEKGRASDHLAKLVGFGSGRTYSKAAKVVTQIDEQASLDHMEVAQALRKVLNEQSVDAAHTLLKKSPQELMAIAKLIINGKAKSTRQAVKMVNIDNHAEFNDPSQPSLAGFSVGDWVEVNENAAQNKNYIGRRGRVEQILASVQQISVGIEGVGDKVRFSPHELSLLVRAAPQNPVHIGDIVFVSIDRHEAASPHEKRWNGFWGKVTQLGEMGSLTVDVGKESLQLFPRDLKPIDAPDSELRSVLERVLGLRKLELDDFEEGILDMFQRREWFKPRQLHYLDFIEKFYLPAASHNADKHQVVQFRGR